MKIFKLFLIFLAFCSAVAFTPVVASFILDSLNFVYQNLIKFYVFFGFQHENASFASSFCIFLILSFLCFLPTFLRD